MHLHCPISFTCVITRLTASSDASASVEMFLYREAGIRAVKESIARLEQKYQGSVPMLSPSSDLKISSSKYKKLQSKLRKLEDMLQANNLNTKCESCSQHVSLCDVGWVAQCVCMAA